MSLQIPHSAHLRWCCLALLLSQIGACSVPPLPPQPAGEYRPINRPPLAQQRARFDFRYSGDADAVLRALQEVQPGLVTLPAQGTPTPLALQLDLRSATLQDTLRAITLQSSKHLAVHWVLLGDTEQVFLDYLPTDAEAAR